MSCDRNDTDRWGFAFFSNLVKRPGVHLECVIAENRYVVYDLPLNGAFGEEHIHSEQ